MLEQYHRALDAFLKGDAEAVLGLFSRREDVTLGNPFGPVARGFDRVGATARLAASKMRDGKATGFENIVRHVSPEFAYIVEIERNMAKVDGRNEVTPVPLRVTTIFLPERGTWKIVHRHADPIASARPWESVIQR